MMRRICMVPSNTLTSPQQASEFALKIIEWPIFQDYLSETLGLPLFATPQVPDDQDWWDVGQRAYAALLSRRHKGKVTFERVNADNPKRPDISTFNGPFVLRFAFGGITKTPPLKYPKREPGRSEIYEIKPNNRKGEKDAQKKLEDVEKSYVGYGISNIYRRGITYPTNFIKTIELKSKYIDVWRYLMNLGLADVKISIQSVDIEVYRPPLHPGVLLYKICVTVEQPDNFSRASAVVAASLAIRMMLVVNSIGQDKEVKTAALAIGETLEPAEPGFADPRQVSPIIAGRDLSKMPYLKLVPDSIVDELKDKLGAIRDAMYSRLIGSPGEQYFLCCDEAYYENTIKGPSLAKVRSQIAMLGFGSSVRSTFGSSMLGMLPAVIVTGKELVKGSPGMAVGAAKWAYAHPEETLIIVTVVVVVTAALILSAGLAAAPLAAAEGTGAVALGGTVVAGEAGGAILGGTVVAEGATGATALAGTATTGGAASTITALASTEGTVIGIPTTIMAQTPGIANVVAAAVPDAALASGATGGTTAASTSAWVRTALAAQPTATELADVAMQKEVDKLLFDVMLEVAKKKVLPTVVPMIAGAAVIGISAAPAYAASSPISRSPSGDGATIIDRPPSVTKPESMIAMQTGKLLVIRVPRLMPYPFTTPPKLYEPFNADRFIDKSAHLVRPQTPLGTLRMLGVLRVT